MEAKTKREPKPLIMRKLKDLNYHELDALKIMIGHYKVTKAADSENHFIFANAIYALLGIETNADHRLAKILNPEFIEEMNQLFKSVKK